MDHPQLSELGIDKSWTLFLDRDGVINRRIIDAYVRNWGEWDWLPGALQSFAAFQKNFGQVFIVTNQRGIARGLMSTSDLEQIHAQLRMEVKEAGGFIDAIYHCPHDRDTGCNCRKPKPGMVLNAMKDFDGINVKKSILVGDSISDMELCFPLGLWTAFIGNELPDELAGRVDFAFESLAKFAAAL